jgi:23S rRNA (guanine2445-N2)-methyltransferase / 23S rRNA (guanine2069-N7)-methyltransferase
VQEYAPPSTIDPGRAETRLRDILQRLPDVLQIPPERVVHKLRRKQKPTSQYQANDTRGERIVIREGGHRFLVNLHDYLDTGLYLDQRQLRARVGEAAKGRTLLNLFCYTGSATVYARDAASTTSVDLSNTYLAWAEDNFALNKLDPRNHRVVKDDCLHWMEAAIASGARYDVIFLAPPTFSNSKGMEATLDLQRDHTAMLESCSRLLAPDGQLYFVNHFRRFKMAAPEGLSVEEITRKTLPPDFQRDARFHNAWLLRRQ